MGALREYVEGRGLNKPRTFEAKLQEFRDAKDDWFDGTPQSVDRRLQKCASLVATAQSAAADDDAFKAVPYLAALNELSEDRRALASLRDDLLMGASGREETYNPPGRRLAKDDNKSRRWVELESARFLADNFDATHDSWELSQRARHYAEKATSTLSPAHSRALTSAFVERVVQRGEQTPRPRTAAQTSVFIGYRDEQLFL